ncbi:MAG TPA: hypothetical protein VGD21_01675 [Lysobacter sp.]
MKSLWSMAVVMIGLAAAPAHAGETTATTLQPMPEALEIRYALSALPRPLRERATAYVLDPATGYRVARQGSSGVECLVQRTVWERGDFRDIYIPLCYDAVGSKTYLQVIRDAAALHAQGMEPAALKAEIEGRFKNKTYRVPEKAGVSYMVAPVMRTAGPPDMQVHTMAMPHLMFYAPGVSNEDIGAMPDLADPATLRYPFIDRQGIDEQSYVIQLVGDAEKARILADEKTLLDDLCAHRDVLCVPGTAHPH